MSDTGFRNPNCTLCPLHQGATNVCINGDGNPEAPIWIIGEAHGYNEDKANKPFVGKAGAVLRDGLDAAEFSDGEVYLTNAVRCRPPGNRKPTNEEIKICSSTYLMKEIEEYKPKYVVPAGGVPLQAVIGRNMAITKARGNPVTLPITKKVKHVKQFKNGNTRETWKDEVVHETTVFPILHPSYAGLRNPSQLPIFMADLANLKKILTVAGQEEIVDYRECTTVDDVFRAFCELYNEERLSIDIETYGQPDAYEFRNEDYKILSCSISPIPGKAYVLSIEHPEHVSAQNRE